MIHLSSSIVLSNEARLQSTRTYVGEVREIRDAHSPALRYPGQKRRKYKNQLMVDPSLKIAYNCTRYLAVAYRALKLLNLWRN